MDKIVIEAYNRTIAELQERIRELEDAIRKFLEADMELDDKLNHPIGVEISSNLYQAVSKAKRELLDIISDNQSDKENADDNK